ncbi:MAG: FAD-dependent oxidoreductase [Alphaproteobacteria bacterium]|nr:FAD-dependent oxidoreductase [Alphaproteobacteria bacterium]
MTADAGFRHAGPAEIDCEIAVIGSGAGGAVAAERLVRAGRDVVLLEEGPYVPAAAAPASITESMRLMWRSGGLSAALGDPPVAFAEGRCVGGGTEINSAIMQRAPEALLDAWRDRYAIEGFGAAALGPFYGEVLGAVGASATPGPPGPPTDRLREGAEALGWKGMALERAQRHCAGTNSCALGCPTGAKQSMTASYLPRALAAGLRLIAECRVRRLVRRGDTVTGIEAVARDAAGCEATLQVRCKAVFVATGAVHTPALLRRAGFRRNVGRTLRLHPTLKMVARFPDELRAHEHRLPLYAVTEFMPDIRLGGSFFLPGLFGMALAEDFARRGHLLPEMARCGMYYAMARGRGAGTVTPLPGAREPLVRYRAAREDWPALAEGAIRLADAMFAAGAEEVFPSIASHPGWRSTAEIRETAGKTLIRGRASLLTIHLAGSCPPGGNAALCATDSFGRLHGARNVVLADASQIPEAPGVNPQASVMAIALRNTEAFLASGDAA